MRVIFALQFLAVSYSLKISSFNPWGDNEEDRSKRKILDGQKTEYGHITHSKPQLRALSYTLISCKEVIQIADCEEVSKENVY